MSAQRHIPTARRVVSTAIRVFAWMAGMIVVTSAYGASSPILVGEWPGYQRGEPLAVVVTTNRTYVAGWTAGFVIYDSSDISAPERMVAIEAENGSGWYVCGLCVNWPYAYITSVGDGGSKFKVIDINDSLHPVVMGSCSLPAGASFSPSIDGNLAAVPYRNGSVMLIDVSVKSNPRIVGTYSGGTSWDMVSVALTGNRLYFGASRLDIVDVTTPATPVRLARTGLNITQVIVKGPLLYGFGRDGLQIFDVSDPSIPKRIGVYEDASASGGMFLSGNNAWVARSRTYVDIVDVSDAMNPVRKNRLMIKVDETWGNGDVLITKYLGDAKYWNIGDPLSPVPKGLLPWGLAQTVAVGQNHVFVADSSALVSVDVRNIKEPKQSQRFAAEYGTRCVAFAENKVAFEDGPNINVMNASNSDALQLLEQFSTRGLDDLQLKGNSLYSVANHEGLQVYRTGNRTPISSFFMGEVLGLVAWNDLVLTTGPIVDVSNPSVPVYRGDFGIFSARDIAVDNNVAVIAVWGSGSASALQLYELSETNLTSPRRLGTQLLPAARPYRTAISGGLAFVSLGELGFEIVDIHDRLQPRSLGRFDTPGFADGMAVKDNHLFVADGSCGVKIYDISGFIRPEVQSINMPAIITVEAGQRVELMISATGGEPLSIQWYKDGNALVGETKTNLVLSQPQFGDSGEYWVTVSNVAGAVESGRSALQVIPVSDAAVTTLAGTGVGGHEDSGNALLAKFREPDGGGVTKDGVIFVGDAGNHVIRYILPSGEVGTWAGKAMLSGYREDVGTNALFNLPLGLAVDSVGDLLVADYANHRVRKALGLGYRSTSLLAGNGTAGFSTAFSYGPNAPLNGPNDLVEMNGNIFFTEFFNHTVRRIDPSGVVTVVAGDGSAGYRDGRGAEARFNGPAGIAAFKGELYVTEWFNNRIRKVTMGGVVTTIAGSGVQGFISGLGTTAELGVPNGIVADADGNFYFTEMANHAVRRLDTNGFVTTLAGASGIAGFADGDRTKAKFNGPGGICMHPDGSLIVMDTYNNRVRRIVVDGKTNGWMRKEGFLTADLRPTLRIFGNVGERYRIDSRDRFGRGDWAPVTSIVLEQSPTSWVDERPDGGMSRLYRAVKE